MEEKLPSREQALRLLHEHLSDPQLLAHSLAAEAIMRRLARKLGEDEELWGLSGLLHDLDLQSVANDMSVHGRRTEQWLSELGFPRAGIEAVLRHNAEGLGLDRTTRFDHALAAAEQITGMIKAATLVLPSRKVADVKAASVLKRMKDKRFAANVDRASIAECGQLGIELPDFIQLSIEAMAEIADELGL
ncbi:MAG: HDIG domain-containing protein [Deltaproteobacteria bacterium]|nr:HDIG domain-containing protein [Deltaproteobacteria bacterium]